MKQRCLNQNSKNYKDYGGKGVLISEDWLTFQNFMNDMYESYLEHLNEHGKKDTSIDRINPEGNYEKENCRWATWKIQNNNKRPG
jgi:hypothetical protein